MQPAPMQPMAPVTGAQPYCAALPQAWLDQLAPGGRLVAPTQDERGGQVLVIVDRLADGRFQHTRAGAVLFVPLKSGTT